MWGWGWRVRLKIGLTIHANRLLTIRVNYQVLFGFLRQGRHCKISFVANVWWRSEG